MPFSYKPLWRLLLEHDLNKTQLREELGLATATMAKMGKNEYVSMEVIDKICNHFNVQPNEIIEWVNSDE
ncbi:helix-turn-helix domain-containing protein [Virgibacillus pantothenticus]|uniref:XRE family transcriptional regulator n=1 Tax=Virgibacillus pantothenticus TaxID=1473 RepID=A0A0L0QM69_VIRPA|nr:helix-turn-helix transcriptional regulator [Virgibacillus pantothenticus]KNE19656.1 XRE family transcriptional regulator [Virgibacillus pantothenticus]MED3736641.1 helix-turn-helix transcriptional regulator [Virgibacillus pantothenticus]QTY14815.1 helix-turn-helix transcriptional regulator [Virgibacillus pantothenticus]SIS79403.1 DNA-binding transcriptional regulator, XRE family [Virgibacillus pantothenticus]